MSLRRGTPLVAKDLRRSRMAVLREEVFLRDRECVAAKLGFTHECRDVIGTPHRPDETYRLSLEHVKEHLAMGRRAPDDTRHCVAVCYGINLRPPTKEMRAAFRSYLREVER